MPIIFLSMFLIKHISGLHGRTHNVELFQVLMRILTCKTIERW